MLKYFKKELITYIDTPKTKDEVIRLLIEKIEKNSNIIADTHEFYSNILEREKLGSTGIGMGVAIPHARSEKFNEIICAVALLKYGVDFNSPDNENVKLVILVGAPKDKIKEYLSFVSMLMRTFRNKAVTENIICSQNLNQLIKTFEGIK